MFHSTRWCCFFVYLGHSTQQFDRVHSLQIQTCIKIALSIRTRFSNATHTRSIHIKMLDRIEWKLMRTDTIQGSVQLIIDNDFQWKCSVKCVGGGRMMPRRNNCVIAIYRFYVKCLSQGENWEYSLWSWLDTAMLKLSNQSHYHLDAQLLLSSQKENIQIWLRTSLPLDKIVRMVSLSYTMALTQCFDWRLDEITLHMCRCLIRVNHAFCHRINVKSAREQRNSHG